MIDWKRGENKGERGTEDVQVSGLDIWVDGNAIYQYGDSGREADLHGPEASLVLHTVDP